MLSRREKAAALALYRNRVTEFHDVVSRHLTSFAILPLLRLGTNIVELRVAGMQFDVSNVAVVRPDRI